MFTCNSSHWSAPRIDSAHSQDVLGMDIQGFHLLLSARSCTRRDIPNAWRYNWAALSLGEINTSWESLKFETVKYVHESRGTWT
jgi:hypothetical protein